MNCDNACAGSSQSPTSVRILLCVLCRHLIVIQILFSKNFLLLHIF